MTTLKMLAVGAAMALLAVGPVQAQSANPAYGPPIGIENARKIMAGAEAEAAKNKWNVVITIVDSGGNLVMLTRLDNTQYGSVDVARDKAKAAVAFRRPTKVFHDLIAQGGANVRLLNLTRDAGILEGGIPIVVGGKLIGGVGVSGVTAQQDAQIAQAGIDALAK